MKKLITAKQHALIDYVLVGALLTVPTLLRMNNKAKKIYATEALILLPYIAITKQPLALKGIIPFKTHGRIDPFNIGQFALQTFLKPFRKTNKELIFNIAFTTVAGATVWLTDWNSSK